MLSLAVFALCGCTGDLDGFVAGSRRTQATQPPQPVELPATPMRRLTHSELTATLRGLVGDEALAAAESAVAALPRDRGEAPFESMAPAAPSLAHVEAQLGIADALASYFASSPSRAAALEPCLGASFERGCVERLLRGFGRRVYRRPLDDEEVRSLLEAYDDGASFDESEGLKAALTVLLASPSFLYRVELGGDPLDGSEDTYRLTGYEIASRLSFLAWGSGPDAALLDAAETGALESEEGRSAELARLLVDARARAHVTRFFAEWLRYDALAPPAHPPSFLADVAPDGLAAAMRAELDQLVLLHVLDEPTTLEELLATRRAVPIGALATVYGVAPSERPVELDDERAGLLTRAGLLYGQGPRTSPIHRGAVVLDRLLCQPLALPDASAFPPDTFVPPPPDPTRTTRERWTALTARPSCAGCHGRINPLGFALEDFDSLGRARDEEPILDADTLEEITRLPIDAVADVDLDGSGSATRVEGGAGLSAAIASHPVAARCFAQQWTRFSEGRAADARDPAVVAVEQAAREGLVMDALASLASASHFGVRRVEVDR